MPKVLVANRGEKLSWQTIALYTDSDTSHVAFADEAVKLGATSEYMIPETIARIARDNHCTHVHPGYGFLSESSLLAALLAQPPPGELPVMFIGPSVEALQLASDKMLSRELAVSLGIPVAPGASVKLVSEVIEFANNLSSGYPVIIKSLDGGGGRGIRVVTRDSEVEAAFNRCLGESPSRSLFVEKALTGPAWRHVEVQIVGDGTGDVIHLFERECSVQRRFQKVVEIAPSRLPRDMVEPLFHAAMKMARQLKYKGLGTFEFLVSKETSEWVFLEINPRVQVEHTVTEEVTSIDLVRTQLLLSLPDVTLASLDLKQQLPRGYAIQLRLTAEDPSRGFSLSLGTIERSNLRWPSGPGVRIDTWLSSPHESWTVSEEFDSLLAKVIVRGETFAEATQRARRAMKEFGVDGSPVKTNAELLLGILLHDAWQAGNVDTTWLERVVDEVLRLGKDDLARRPHISTGALPITQTEGPRNTIGASSTSLLLQPGATFHLSFTGLSNTAEVKHVLTLSSISRNAFPEELSGTIRSTLTPDPVSFSLTQASSAHASSAAFELANPNDPSHIGVPLTGKVVELHPALTQSAAPAVVRKGETIVVLSAMKMENAVFAPHDGLLQRRGRGIEMGAVVGEGVLLCIINKEDKVPTSRL
ncbi:hypothetical protein HYDPIDRAFT_92999 [Hydnomerulius pinastri MD-312]|uniref:Pyruvate carboxylase n=1 Tax=Hydnomerulius pinastri MD-312 TaxID=994086 RepID=A0A0C9VY38_9AGAM|nr:hypothetical protein HYDPIDRAFT_92999 [Hydnomerulius pinastri MD-312]